MVIRLAVLSDVAAVRSCAAEAYEKYVDRIGRKPAPMIADFDTLTDQGKVHVACDDDGHVQGYVVFYLRNGSMHLENVAVMERCQGAGIGRKLVEFCENAARNAGLGKVELYTNEMMTENLTLYAKLGYQETARRTEDGFNRVYFEKALR